MTVRLWLSTLGLLAALPSAAAAQTASAATPDVVVTAHKALDTRAAVHFVRQIAAPTQQQLARFTAPVCPAAIGFAPPIEALIVARLRAVAVQAGAEVATAGCRPNVTLLTNADARALLRKLRYAMPQMFAGMESQAIDSLIGGDGPVRAWAATAVTSESGGRATPSPTDAMDPPRLAVDSASILNPGRQQVIDAAYLVIDTSATLGKTVTQIADYAAMRTLAQTRPVHGGETSVDTILSLFDGGAAPGLTFTDAAYLKALYAVSGNRRLDIQVSAIASSIRKATTASDGGR